MRATLAWGRHYVMVRAGPLPGRLRRSTPSWTSPTSPTGAARWRSGTPWSRPSSGSAAPSTCSPQRADAPDMVYAMNLGLGARRAADGGPAHVVLSHMRYAERRMETASAQPLVRRRTAAPRRTSVATASAPTSRPATCSPCGDALVAGYGPRTEELALKHLADDLGVRVRGVRITHPGMYHLDLAFCPLDDRRAMVCPGAFDDASRRRAARPGARAAGAHRGGGADDVLRQLDRASAGTVVMPAVPRPRARPARGVGLRRRAGRRLASSTRAAARSAA